MFECPACALAEFSDDNVAVAEHFDVKVDVETGLGDVRRLEDGIEDVSKDLRLEI